MKRDIISLILLKNVETSLPKVLKNRNVSGWSCTPCTLNFCPTDFSHPVRNFSHFQHIAWEIATAWRSHTCKQRQAIFFLFFITCFHCPPHDPSQ